MEKTIWLTESRIGPRPQFLSEVALCRLDPDNPSGADLLYLNENSTVLITLGRGTPATTLFLPLGWLSLLYPLDVDGDGVPEYVGQTSGDQFEAVFSTIQFFDEHGGLVWSRPGFEWSTVDIEGDGVLEFLIQSKEGVFLLNTDGTERARIGNTSYFDALLADVTGDRSWVLVTYGQPLAEAFSQAGDLGPIQVWDLDGVLLSEIDPGDLAGPFIVRWPADPSRDYIGVGCDIFDIDGRKVGALDSADCKVAAGDLPNGFRKAAGTQRQVFGVEYEPLDCRATITIDMPDLTFPPELTFSSASFRAEVSYTVRESVTPGPDGPIIGGDTLRTIIRIYDAGDVLVYHEVLTGRSGAGSAVMIPGSAEDEEVLLVADGTQILAYRVR